MPDQDRGAQMIEPMKAVLTRRALLRPGLDLRAQARRRTLPRVPRRWRGTAALAHRSPDERLLPGAGRGSRARALRRLRRRRRDRRLRRRRTSFSRLQRRMQLSDPARSATRVAVFLYVFDLSAPRRRGPARAAAARAQGAPAPTRSSFEGPVRFTPHRNERRRGALPRGLREGPRGRDRQARRQPLRAAAARATG